MRAPGRALQPFKYEPIDNNDYNNIIILVNKFSTHVQMEYGNFPSEAVDFDALMVRHVCDSILSQ